MRLGQIRVKLWKHTVFTKLVVVVLQWKKKGNFSLSFSAQWSLLDPPVYCFSKAPCCSAHWPSLSVSLTTHWSLDGILYRKQKALWLVCVWVCCAGFVSFVWPSVQHAKNVPCHVSMRSNYTRGWTCYAEQKQMSPAALITLIKHPSLFK